MKELSMEEKAKAYDEAIERTSKLIDEGCLNRMTGEFIFPELKESEDEKIKNWIKKELESKYVVDNIVNNVMADKALAWLEKQRKDDIGISESTKQKLEDNLNKALEKETPESWNEFLDGQGEQKETLCDKCKKAQPSHSCQDITALGRCALEKQGEQKPDKVEPKFKVGDWVIDTITKEVEQVIELTGCEYICSGHLIVSFNNQHLLKRWTIQDAKDGDVLVHGEQLFLFKRTNTSNSFYAHCNYHFIGYDSLSVDDCSYSIDNIYPATKEQRDLLFQKMKEAGYEWDSEKKELKKIENEPTWSENDENAIKVLRNIIRKSEMIDSIIYTDSLKEKLYDWVKSIKDRVQVQLQNKWKPSDKQMNALDSTLQYNRVSRNSYEHLNSLYNDLKKLKE